MVLLQPPPASTPASPPAPGALSANARQALLGSSAVVLIVAGVVVHCAVAFGMDALALSRSGWL